MKGLTYRAALVAVCIGVTSAQADTIQTFDLVGVRFNDGGTATGSFALDLTTLVQSGFQGRYMPSGMISEETSDGHYRVLMEGRSRSTGATTLESLRGRPPAPLKGPGLRPSPRSLRRFNHVNGRIPVNVRTCAAQHRVR
jgi:hypothetical protein